LEAYRDFFDTASGQVILDDLVRFAEIQTDPLVALGIHRVVARIHRSAARSHEPTKPLRKKEDDV